MWKTLKNLDFLLFSTIFTPTAPTAKKKNLFFLKRVETPALFHVGGSDAGRSSRLHFGPPRPFNSGAARSWKPAGRIREVTL